MYGLGRSCQEFGLMLLWYNDALMSPVTDYEVRVSLTGTKQGEKRVGFHTEKESVQIVSLYADQNRC